MTAADVGSYVGLDPTFLPYSLAYGTACIVGTLAEVSLFNC